MQRTADAIIEENSEFLIIPSKVLTRLARDHQELNVMLHTTIRERLSLWGLPPDTDLGQSLLRELHRLQPNTKVEPVSRQC